MDKGFLPRLARHFYGEYGNSLHKVAFVFPNRRAGLFFKKYLREEMTENLWAPPVFAFSDFVSSLSELRCAEPLELVFELYQVYSSKVNHFRRDFEDFYPWGKMILADFDEIDEFLIDSGELFRHLKEYGEIEKLDLKGKSDIYKRYVGFWGDLEILYREFKRDLKAKNKAYQGLIYREVAEHFPVKGKKAWEKVVFCCLNALTRAEEKIIMVLKERGQAELFWDMDRYFVNDKNQEAGFFFRKNQESGLVDENVHWLEDSLLESKNIHVHSVPTKVSQAKVLGVLLQEAIDNGVNPEDVVVVLPDESLLFPVLNSLPPPVEKVNVTMGYPLRQTPVFSLFNSLVLLQKNMKDGAFYYKDITNVLNHPYIRPLFANRIAKYLRQLKEKNQLYSDDYPSIAPEIDGLFQTYQDPLQLIREFLQFLELLRDHYTREGRPLLYLDMEYVFHFYRHLSQLADIFKKFDFNLTIPAFWKLFSDIIANTRLSFTGEPLEGLQMMGMLETQALSFKHIYILSLNEGILPVGKRVQSFIPNDIREPVGLSTHKEQDAIVAYHFYRLLKQGEEVHLIYTENTGEGIAKGEKSRFIDQILIELSKKSSGINITEKIYDFSFTVREQESFEIPKRDTHLDQLKKRSFSASSLWTFMTCPVKFYFSYVLNLQEDDEIYESPDSRMIGNIVHKVLERMYRPFVNKDVTSEALRNLLSKMNQVIADVFTEVTGITELDTGRNRIIAEILKAMLKNFLKGELSNPAFTLVAVEKVLQEIPFSVNLRGNTLTVHLKGFIDRVDRVEEGYRIIDYKTGNIKSLKLKNLEDFTEESMVKAKELFQLMFYHYLIGREGNYTGPFRLGIYPLKDFASPISLRYVSVDKEEIISTEMVAGYERTLGEIFQKIFDPNIPFFPTEDEDVCRYCSFGIICHRENISFDKS